MNTLRRFPTTISLFGLVLLVGLITARMTTSELDTLQAAVGLDWPALTVGRLWGIPVATLVQSAPGIEWHMLLLVALPLLALEMLVGSLRTLICFLASDWLTAPITVIILRILGEHGNAQATVMMVHPDTGSSAAAHGVLAAAIMQLPRRWAVICWIILTGISIWALTFESLDAAIAHLLGIATGTALGYYYRTHPRYQNEPMA